MSEMTQNPSIIIDKSEIEVPLMFGETPTSGRSKDLPDMFDGGFESRPVNPKSAVSCSLMNGTVLATAHTVAEGTAGAGFDIVARTKDIDQNNPKSWSKEVKEQRDKLQVFVQTAFTGSILMSLRDGFMRMELDRFILGWGGIIVRRDPVPHDRGLRRPMDLERFEACGARFTKIVDKTPVMCPMPVGLDDGSVTWVEVPRLFRHIAVESGTSVTWYKEYGDWRSMDAKTGRYSSGAKRTEVNGKVTYVSGALPKGAVPASELAHWETPFPGVYPYGVSAWHAEFAAVRAAHEHIMLVLDYLKSGLHSVILAAANRKFDSVSADAATHKIDELGRGRQGMGSLILIELQPIGSANSPMNSAFDVDRTSDRGKLVLHELNTKLAPELVDDTLANALGERISESERIPGLLLGRSESYNFATASAAWTTANRLRFSPHHRTHEAFLDTLLLEMGITHWRLSTKSPEWDQQEPIASVTQSIGTYGGITVNRALLLLERATGMPVKQVQSWWGDLPLTLVNNVLNSENPQAVLDSLDLPNKPKMPIDPSSIGKEAESVLADIDDLSGV